MASSDLGLSGCVTVGLGFACIRYFGQLRLQSVAAHPFIHISAAIVVPYEFFLCSDICYFCCYTVTVVIYWQAHCFRFHLAGSKYPPTWLPRCRPVDCLQADVKTTAFIIILSFSPNPYLFFWRYLQWTKSCPWFKVLPALSPCPSFSWFPYWVDPDSSLVLWWFWHYGI